jgi:hypothetical protein
MIHIQLAKRNEDKLPNLSFRQTYHCWCEKQFGPHAVNWWNYNGTFSFHYDEDATLFLLKWS